MNPTTKNLPGINFTCKRVYLFDNKDHTPHFYYILVYKILNDN